ncbi:Phosphate transporter [Acidisarcina polymorpha]|uniref:Phosphate transporter n=1 Tax=Acidisarcina polymorpha TaxID=2211140 RepID=A0A2Z5G9W1_9BACT|nr:MFS transporter [Acidisarcina polymorpha]AXC15355.1 Phosphate transporter [Acidisarcina polymorpha]
MATSSATADFQAMDDAKPSATHWKIMWISGMGFFTDAYDLFIIGVVMAILKKQWHVSHLDESLVESTALLASAIGALLFGRVADMLGRKRIYGVEVLVLAAGAIACAFSPNIYWLIALRFILGIGIGGDYPVSATIMSEYAGKSSRGMLVSLVFAMQAAGLIVGPLFASALLATPLSQNIIWRILVGFGAVPALAVYWQRRGMKESPRYLKAAGKKEDGSDEKSGPGNKNTSGDEESPKAKSDFSSGFSSLFGDPKLRIRLIGASLAWFLMDFAYYGNTVSSPLVLGALGGNDSLIKKTLTQLGIFAVFAAPGYAIAALTMDKLGRKFIQNLGFFMMAAAFSAMAFVPGLEKKAVPFLIIYGISFFFTEFGPNSTTFVYPSEIFPVEQRTTGHGIASAMGKLGGFVGVFLFPIFMHWKGLLAAESAAATVCVLGLIVTSTMLPETKGKSLEELSEPSSKSA